MGPQLAPPTRLDDVDRAWVQEALDLFIDGMIGRGVVIVPALRRALPGPARL